MAYKIIVNDLATTYADDGAGPVLLLLHGWSSSAVAFQSLAAGLLGSFRVIRLDLPGFGGSEQPKSDWHIQDYAAFVQAFLAKLGVGQVFAVVGHSFGGRVAIKALANGLLRPAKLVLIDSGGVRESQSARNRLLKIVAKTGKVVTSLPGLRALQGGLRKKLYARVGSTDYIEAGGMKQIFLNTINEDLQADATHITTPTLIVWGQDDTTTPISNGQLLANAIKGATMVVIPDAGHFVFLDQPQQTLDHLKQFLT